MTAVHRRQAHAVLVGNVVFTHTICNNNSYNFTT